MEGTVKPGFTVIQNDAYELETSKSVIHNFFTKIWATSSWIMYFLGFIPKSMIFWIFGPFQHY